MLRQGLSHPLRSRVGRRIASVVLAASLLPVAAIGSYLFARARDQQEDLELRRLHQQAKTVALNGVERLSLLEQRLSWMSDSIDPRAWTPEALTAVLGSFEGVEALVVWDVEAGRHTVLRGASTPVLFRLDVSQRLREGQPLLVVDPTPRYWLVVPGASHQRAAAARLPLEDIFSLGERSLLPPSVVGAVLDAQGRVVAIGGEQAEAARGALLDAGHGASALPSHGVGEIRLGGAAYRTRTWALPLERGYRAGVWTVALLEPRDASLSALDRFGRDVVLLSALSVVIVVLAVLWTIRRTLQPLQVLEAAAARVARREFDVIVDVATRDEFEDLARACNAMIAELKSRFEALEEFSEGTATALARTIDAKSPWTAGHSDRVTALALDIGREMGLPPADIETLQRGGLLHDIGKLATPPAVLDKAGPLTPEERQIIERHPLDGARILEPIPRFASILPIVVQHHERFDGTGYPHGLAGTDIALFARILAVADVFDALTSDRPYRPGWAHAKAVAYVRDAAGTHFDPDVVAAFTKVVGRHVAERPSSSMAS